MFDLSSAYSGSFKSIGFLEEFDGMLGVEPDTEGEISARKVPGGNRTVIQSSGRLIQSLDLPIGCEAAQLASLRAAVETQGSLVYHAGTRTAYLRAVRNVRKVAQFDGYKATLEMYLL